MPKLVPSILYSEKIISSVHIWQSPNSDTRPGLFLLVISENCDYVRSQSISSFINITVFTLYIQIDRPEQAERDV